MTATPKTLLQIAAETVHRTALADRFAVVVRDTAALTAARAA